MFEKIGIIGCGLIGSSILRGINNKKICKSLTVYDKSKDVLEIIGTLGGIQEILIALIGTIYGVVS